MSVFFNATPEVAEFVDVAKDLNFNKLKKHLKQAERELKIMFGADFFQEIQDFDQEDLEELEMYETIREYVANRGLLLALNGLNLDISNGGIQTLKPANTNNAEWYKLKDLARDLTRNANNALDYALMLFEMFADSLVNWQDSEIKKRLADCRIKSLADFEKFFSLNKSHSVFYDLVPFIKEAQVRYIDDLLGECGSTELPESLQNDINGALANLTLASITESGIFKIESNGALVKVEVLPWEKVELIPDQRLKSLHDQRLKTAEKYLSKIMTAVQQLPCYALPSVEPRSIQRKKSGLYL